MSCLIMGPVTLLAQMASEKIPSQASFARRHLFPDTAKTTRYVSFGTFTKEGKPSGLPLPSLNNQAPSPLPAYPVYMMASHAYYDQHFGFFCKKEWTWQKQTGIPVKLRLGSYQLTQQQEGKH
ncbi:hypothetical protein HHL17_03230 [Chitinophaga sp. G-6-1-13]|uniref:Uncharacterized protein n=1 Tax=Chitinophaga fulva TaxID=2728842 RepID=A0A848GGM2_9BACT|nr:hypothetical protein [Chitinophaga fulva]NML36202.1 hypothetical protein [Chitinophaga fulva]